MDSRLQKIVKEMVEEERRRKKPRVRGKIAKIIKTKKDNLMFVLEDENLFMREQIKGLLENE